MRIVDDDRRFRTSQSHHIEQPLLVRRGERIANDSYLRIATEYLLGLWANGIDVFFEIVVSSSSFDSLLIYGKCDQRDAHQLPNG